MRIYEKVNRLRFNLAVRSILRTPPVKLQGHEYTLLSMVQHRDVYSYLLAVKSFCRYAEPSRVVVIADSTLDTMDRALIRRHVPGVELCEARNFQRDGIPTGGCWERFCAIADFVRDSYVIQLDADTVAVQPLPEVLAAVEDGTAFTLGTEDDMTIVSCSEIAAWARPRLSARDHVQLVAESLLDQIEASTEYRYVRGCAGFAGYPRASLDFAMVREFSHRMEQVLPDRWSEWGSEQFSSNVLIASMPGARVLPHPKYCAPHRRRTGTVFMHFIGYVRYATPLYARMASQISKELLTAA
ncbi:MAG TPA: hypothetical protein VMV91_15190 [Rhodocyclaceae bacterium]|nr:hypothetical protein [Rhodocyclaceae bacterium]HUY02645.1 hypothetical protein [Rhodocyclaceae bacterium]